MRWSSRGHCVFRLYSVCKRWCVCVASPSGQPRAAGAPPEAASSLPLSSSPAQRELPEKQGPPSISPAAPHSGISLRNRLLPPSINPAAPRSGSSPKNKLLPPSIEQPRAAGAPPETASSLHQYCSPAQRELPQKQPLLSINTAAPSSGSSPRNSLFSPSILQPRAAGAPPDTASSLPLSSSPEQRELPQKQPLLSINPAAPRSGSSTRNSLLPLSIGQPRAAGNPHESACSLHQSGGPAQQELPLTQPLLSLYQAAPRSGSSPRNRLLTRSFHRAAPRSESSTRNRPQPPSIRHPRAAGASPETGSRLPLYR